MYAKWTSGTLAVEWQEVIHKKHLLYNKKKGNVKDIDILFGPMQKFVDSHHPQAQTAKQPAPPGTHATHATHAI